MCGCFYLLCLGLFFLLRQPFGTVDGSITDDVCGDLEDVVAETSNHCVVFFKLMLTYVY